LDTVGHLTDRAHPDSVQLVYLVLELRDHIALHRIKRHRSHAQNWILHEHEEDVRQQLPALEDRGIKSFGNEPPESRTLL